MKKCPNCQVKHNGMFESCYPCFDCESEEEYKERTRNVATINGEWHGIYKGKIEKSSKWDYNDLMNQMSNYFDNVTREQLLQDIRDSGCEYMFEDLEKDDKR